MTTKILKIAVLAIALAAIGQTVHKAYADQREVSAFADFAVQERIMILLQKKSALENQGADLMPAESLQLYKDMGEVMSQMKAKTQARSEGPTI